MTLIKNLGRHTFFQVGSLRASSKLVGSPVELKFVYLTVLPVKTFGLKIPLCDLVLARCSSGSIVEV
jgi:hypothetical protein